MIAPILRPSNFGALETLEIYEYYDGPKLFTATSAGGVIFLALWIGAAADSESFLLAMLSKERFQIVRSGGLELSRAFSDPETGILLRCDVSFGDGSNRTSILLPEAVEPGWLPSPGEVLDLHTETMPRRLANVELHQKAIASQREHIALHLNFRDMTREEAPSKDLGRILLFMQETIDSLAQGLDGGATMRGAISPSTLKATETRVVYAGGGSFGLEISAAEPVDLFGDSLISRTISSLLRLIEDSSNADKLRAHLVEIEPRATSKYSLFLSALVASEASIRLEWASPVPDRNTEVTLPLQVAAGALKTAQSLISETRETWTEVGYFMGVQLLGASSFTAVFPGKEHVFRGKILDSARAEADHVTMNEYYRITIREGVAISSSGEEKPRYELEKIELLDSEVIPPEDN